MLAVGIPPILYDHASEPIARKKKGGREKNGSIRCGEGLTESTWPTLRPAIYSRLKAVSLNFITPPRNSRIYRDDKLEVTGSNRVCNPRCVQGWFIYLFFFLFSFLFRCSVAWKGRKGSKILGIFLLLPLDDGSKSNLNIFLLSNIRKHFAFQFQFPFRASRSYLLSPRNSPDIPWKKSLS